MFETLQMAPPDAILGLNEAFKRDPHPDKINLSVGVYKDASGNTPVLRCVKQAEQRLLDSESNKSYLGIDGLAEYDLLAQELLLGTGHELLSDNRVVTAQTPGGTGALRVAAEFMHQHVGVGRIWCSKPTWANHPNVFAAAGMDVQTYPYYDASSCTLDFEAMIGAVEQIAPGDAICLHGCCHNPTGVDPTPEQWQQVATVLQRRGVLPLVDLAYQGFSDGVKEDVVGLLTLLGQVDEAVICSSFSKNFGLYGERVGALSVVAASAESAAVALSHVKKCIRTNYSNPPKHGAAVVSTVLADDKLRADWLQELAEMRDRINGMRQLFVKSMAATGANHDFSFMTNQKGMFSFSGLTPLQVDQLREQYSIYAVGSGRINVAGMTASNMGRLCEAIADVISG